MQQLGSVTTTDTTCLSCLRLTLTLYSFPLLVIVSYPIAIIILSTLLQTHRTQTEQKRRRRRLERAWRQIHHFTTAMALTSTR